MSNTPAGVLNTIYQTNVVPLQIQPPTTEVVAEFFNQLNAPVATWNTGPIVCNLENTAVFTDGDGFRFQWYCPNLRCDLFRRAGPITSYSNFYEPYSFGQPDDNFQVRDLHAALNQDQSFLATDYEENTPYICRLTFQGHHDSVAEAGDDQVFFIMHEQTAMPASPTGLEFNSDNHFKYDPTYGIDSGNVILPEWARPKTGSRIITIAQRHSKYREIANLDAVFDPVANSPVEVDNNTMNRYHRGFVPDNIVNYSMLNVANDGYNIYHFGVKLVMETNGHIKVNLAFHWHTIATTSAIYGDAGQTTQLTTNRAIRYFVAAPVETPLAGINDGENTDHGFE